MVFVAGIMFHYGGDKIMQGNLTLSVILAIVILIIILTVVAISRQPIQNDELPFKVIFVHLFKHG